MEIMITIIAHMLFSDDKSVGYFDLHYDEIKDKFICFNAGKQGRINEFMDKQRILELAKNMVSMF